MMKYQRLKDMIMVAMVATLIVGTAPNAFAKESKINIPISFNNIKVVIDGKELKTDKEPFTYEGTTYLPVRAVAEAVGKDVKWDSKTQTVILGEASQIANKSEMKTVSRTIGNLSFAVPETWKEEKADESFTYYLNDGVILMESWRDSEYDELENGGIDGFLTGFLKSDKAIDSNSNKYNKKNFTIGDIKGKKVDINVEKQYNGVNVKVKSGYFIESGANIVFVMYCSTKDSSESDKQLENMIASFKQK